MDDAIDALAAAVREADAVVALTGAGVSAPSGVPTFRGEDGVWERFDQRDFHVRRFQADPEGFWRDRLELRTAMLGDGTVEPNAAHEALAEMEATGALDGVVTQNVDGLHQAAGSDRVVELHGSNREVECIDCGAREPAQPVVERVEDGEVPPTCVECGGVCKPAVVLFGESMPDGPLLAAHDLVGDADVLLAVGSSLTVQPAASLPERAQRAGATLGIVNLEATPVSERAAHDIRADAAEVLPTLAERA